jgi:exopolyphosphatase
LRPELDFVLQRAGINQDDLLTLSELPDHRLNPASGLAPESTRWLLADHNALTGPLETRGYGSRVVGCIDHHEEEGKVPRDVEGEPRIIQRCGSCSSLVVERYKSLWRDLSKADQDAKLDAQLAHVALAPILVDTVNLTVQGRTTDTDLQAVSFVEQFLVPPVEDSKPAFDREALYIRLSELKEDLSTMSPRDIFRKDYKLWVEGGLRLGICMATQDFEYLSKLAQMGGDEGFLEKLRSWATEQELDIVAVMTTSRPAGGFKRALFVWALREDAVKVVKDFTLKNQEILALEPWSAGSLDDVGGKSEWRRCWAQGRAEHSRKQVAPMLREAMKEASKL